MTTIEEVERQFAVTGVAPPAVAVLDTNVYLAVHSCHDLREALKQAFADVSAVADPFDHEHVVLRRVLARESLLLAIYLNRIGATTFSLGDEARSKLGKKVLPDAPSLERDHTCVFLWFVKSRLLPRWKTGGWSPAAGPAPTGSAADRWLIARAKERGLPLVTNEGITKHGYAEGKIAKWARAEGVRTQHPKDFYAGKMDEAAEIDAFLRGFVELAPAYCDEHPGEQDALETTFGTFRHVLLGETPGRVSPVKMSLP